MHLAQLNVGRLRAPMDDPIIDDFRTNLAPINALAEVSPGFVWRLQDDSGNATDIQVFDDELVIINLTVWESIEPLWSYVYGGGHLEVMRRRREWMAKLDEIHMALWWVPAGHIPTIEEAEERLNHLRTHGPSDRAFTFKQQPVAR